MHVAALYTYPVKSMHRVEHERVRTTSCGFQGDRRFMVARPDGAFVTQRTVPQLAAVHAREHAGVLTLESADAGTVSVRVDTSAPAQRMRVWRARPHGVDQGDEVARWLTELTGEPLRLVCKAADDVRLVSAAYRARPDDQVRFQDGFRFHLASEASLTELNARIGDEEALPMTRFRPNIVVRGAQPFDDDTWKRIRIGDLEFDVVHHCTRCKVTTVDQERGVVTGTEPLRTLATFRRTRKNKVAFGVHLSHMRDGLVAVGDAVEVVERRARRRKYR